MNDTDHLTTEELEAGLASIYHSPQDGGTLELIVRRPQVEQRETLQGAELTREEGLVGDNWKALSSSRMPDGSPHPEMQVTLMNSRVISLLARNRERWNLAGDQLYVDLDLSAGNLPPGTRLEIGSAVVEITAQPHTGCKKFAARFGLEALAFISAPPRKDLRLRGIYARVVQPGRIHTGDIVKKVIERGD